MTTKNVLLDKLKKAQELLDEVRLELEGDGGGQVETADDDSGSNPPGNPPVKPPGTGN